MTCNRLAGLCLFALACTLGGPVGAYSDEAVSDAEQLLGTITGRVMKGEASPQDMAVARYHLLEMTWAAGRISADTFCTQAASELQVMATARGDEETKAGLSELGDKIAAMTRSPDDCRQACAAVDGFLFGAPVSAVSDADVADAERARDKARKRYKAGEVDRTDLARAEANALDAAYGAGKLDREAYCRSGQATTLANLAAWVEARAQVGQAGLLEQIEARRRLYRFKALCR